MTGVAAPGVPGPSLETPGSADPAWNVLNPLRLIDRVGVMPNQPTLVKAITDAVELCRQHRPPGNAGEWGRRRADVDAALRRSLGLDPLPPRTPLSMRITARHEFPDYTIENVLFESRPGFLVSGNLYRPLREAGVRRPAILSPIGHFLSAGKTATDVQARCIGLVRLGFVVLAYDAIGQGERMVPGNIHHEAGYALLPLGETIAGWMVWDSIRALDLLAGLPDVDASRMGMTGNSGGGLNTLLTAALDDRVAAAAVVGFTFEFDHWVRYGGTHCTCTHFPGAFRDLEWFEIAALIAPRSLLLIQGAEDRIFPISGARRAASRTAGVFGLLGATDRFRFVELAGQPHAYSRPFREPMYAWMARHLGDPSPATPGLESGVVPLPERDPRLLCDPARARMPSAPNVVDIARARAAFPPAADLRMTNQTGWEARARSWVGEMSGPPETAPHGLCPQVIPRRTADVGEPERFSFLSEDGQSIPGLLWMPAAPGAIPRVAVVADSRGKGATAVAPWRSQLVDAGVAVLAVDLRGRGETTTEIRPGWDIQFRLAACQVLAGRPLAGRRAFDVRRTVDYVLQRPEFSKAVVGAIGVRDDAFPVLLAASADTRIQWVVSSGGTLQAASTMVRAKAWPVPQMGDHWNDPQLNGRIDGDEGSSDFGNVIPGMLRVLDLPDLTALVAPRRLLLCGVQDGRSGQTLAAREFYVARASGAEAHLRFEPGTPMDGRLLLEFLRAGGSRSLIGAEGSGGR